MNSELLPSPPPDLNIGRLPRGSPTRKLIHILASGAAIQGRLIDAMTEILRDTSPWRFAERRAAAWVLPTVKMNSARRAAVCEALTDVLADTIPPNTRQLVQAQMEMLAPSFLFAIGFSAISVGMFDYQPAPFILKAIPACLAVGCVIAVIPTLRLARRIGGDRGDFNQLRASAAESLGRLQYKGAVGPLADGLFDSSPLVRDCARPAFLSCATSLRPYDLGALRPKTSRRLAGALRHADDEIVTTTLNALECVGEPEAIPAVFYIVERGATSELRAHARSVMDLLIARKQSAGHAGSLLRASIAPENEEQRLLRTAASPDLSPAALMRPASVTYLDPSGQKYRQQSAAVTGTSPDSD